MKPKYCGFKLLINEADFTDYQDDPPTTYPCMVYGYYNSNGEHELIVLTISDVGAMWKALDLARPATENDIQMADPFGEGEATREPGDEYIVGLPWEPRIADEDSDDAQEQSK